MDAEKTQNELVVSAQFVESMSEIWRDDTILVEQPQKIFRWSGPGPRRYFTVDETGVAEEPFKVSWYLSVTSLLDAAMPTPDSLIRWIADNGYENAMAIRDSKACYGTFMHILISEFLIGGKLDLDLSDRMARHYEEEGFPLAPGAAEDMKRDLVAFAQFAHEYNLKPLAIEIVLTMGKIAGAIDLVATIDIEEKGFFGEVYKSGPNKGEPRESKQTKTIMVIIDYKSSRSGFYESAKYQLALYREMWRANYPEMGAVVCYNWRPKDWRIAPSYELKEQDVDLNELTALTEWAYRRCNFEPPASQVMPASITLGEKPAIEHYGPEERILDGLSIVMSSQNAKTDESPSASQDEAEEVLK